MSNDRSRFSSELTQKLLDTSKLDVKLKLKQNVDKAEEEEYEAKIRPELRRLRDELSEIREGSRNFCNEFNIFGKQWEEYTKCWIFIYQLREKTILLLGLDTSLPNNTPFIEIDKNLSEKYEQYKRLILSMRKILPYFNSIPSLLLKLDQFEKKFKKFVPINPIIGDDSEYKYYNLLLYDIKVLRNNLTSIKTHLKETEAVTQKALNEEFKETGIKVDSLHILLEKKGKLSSGEQERLKEAEGYGHEEEKKGEQTNIADTHGSAPVKFVFHTNDEPSQHNNSTLESAPHNPNSTLGSAPRNPHKNFQARVDASIAETEKDEDSPTHTPPKKESPNGTPPRKNSPVDQPIADKQKGSGVNNNKGLPSPRHNGMFKNQQQQSQQQSSSQQEPPRKRKDSCVMM